MARNFDFASTDPEAMVLYDEVVQQDSERQQLWAPYMYSNDMTPATKHPDSANSQGIIKVNKKFAKGAKGNSVLINNVANLVGTGIEGDGLAIAHRNNIDNYTQEMFYSNYVEVTETSGELAEMRSVLDFRAVSHPLLSSWARRKNEGAIVGHLWGLTAPGNGSTVMTYLNYNAQQTSILNNTIKTFDSTETYYAGDATSDATIDSGDLVTAQSLSELERFAVERDVPPQFLDIDGEDTLLLFLSGKGCNQLRYDPDWQKANQYFTKGTNPMLKSAIGRFGRIVVINYANALTVSTNVGRGVLCGKDALQLVPVKPPTLFEEWADLRKRRGVISIGGMLGVTATEFNGTRRNSIAYDHYIAS
jgi:N4-gp56 family major capsid protein